MTAGQRTGHGFEQDFAAEHFDAREAKVRTDFWAKVKRFAARLPFLDDLIAVYYCALDRETPLRVRGMLLGALAYFIMPADVIPDIIAGLGFTDDAAVIATVISLLNQHIKPKHRKAAREALGRDLDTEGASR